MPGFQFKLAGVLSLRRNARELCRAQLAETCLAERRLLDRRRALQQELDEQICTYRQATAGGPLDVDRLGQLQQYELVLEAKLRTVDQQLSGVLSEVETQRQALHAADGEVRALEKLHDVQRERYRREQATLETKVLDEVAGRQCQRAEDSTANT